MHAMTRVLRNLIAVLSLAAVLAPMTASAAPLAVIHLHPHTTVVDERVTFTLHNKSVSFRDVKVDGKTYTVLPHHELQIKAPVGTRVYAGSAMMTHGRGSVVVEVTPAIQNQQVFLD